MSNKMALIPQGIMGLFPIVTRAISEHFLSKMASLKKGSINAVIQLFSIRAILDKKVRKEPKFTIGNSPIIAIALVFAIGALFENVKFTINVPKKENPITLIFTGDIMLSRGVLARIERNQNPKFPFVKIAEVTNKADVTFGNLENPISERGRNVGSVYSFRANPKVIEGLMYAGFDVVSIANNHIWDYGRDALEDTITLLKKSNIAPIGAGMNEEEASKPHIIRNGSTTIAFLASTNLYPQSLVAYGAKPGVSPMAGLEERVRELKAKTNIVVVSLHWGDEYEEKSNGTQQKIGKALIDAGADLVIGHHPHVVQEIEQYKKGWIAYSLGNFIFDQNFSEETMKGMIVQAKVEEGKVTKVTPIKIKINKDFQPELEGVQ